MLFNSSLYKYKTLIIIITIQAIMLHNFQMIQKRNMILVNGINTMIAMILSHYNHMFQYLILIQIHMFNRVLKLTIKYLKIIIKFMTLQMITNLENLDHQLTILLLMITDIVINNYSRVLLKKMGIME